jgi:hypothetical protein
MARIVISLEFNQKISSTLSLLLVLLLSTLVALLTVKAAKDIIDMAQNAPAYHIEKRAGGGAAVDMMK